MAINFHPGLKKAGIDPNTIQQLIDVAKVPVESAKKRKQDVADVKSEVEALQSLLSDLDQSLNGLKSTVDFNKLKLESSHPDLIDGSVGPGALLGTYELEVRGLARSEKELAYGFPDKNETPVGFGFMLIEREDKEPFELTVEPYTTLDELAHQVNDSDLGVKAMVVNTGYKPDPYRLLLISEESGKEAKFYVDEDTTFLEFKEQVTGKNLDILFEDVPVTDMDNQLDELISDVTLHVKRSEPGTRVQVSIVHDIEATVEGIKSFVDAYNNVASFVGSQFMENPETGKRGKLASDGSIKTIMRQLQSALFRSSNGGGKFSTLAQIGITTDPKTGVLRMDDAKVSDALTEDYDSVAHLFVNSRDSVGVAGLLASRLKGFRDPVSGVIKSRIRGLDRIIKNQDQEIERRERQLTQREQTIKRQFTNLESNLTSLQSQGDFLKAKLSGNKG